MRAQRKQMETRLLVAGLQYVYELCSLHILCRHHSCVEMPSTDANCMYQWFRLQDSHDIYGTRQPNVSSFEECQKTCEPDPLCDDVYFWGNTTFSLCYTNTVQDDSPSLNYSTKVAHFGLFSPYTVTSGKCFDNILLPGNSYEHAETLKPIRSNYRNKYKNRYMLKPRLHTTQLNSISS